MANYLAKKSAGVGKLGQSSEGTRRLVRDPLTRLDTKQSASGGSFAESLWLISVW
jgi:hypothetical protein